MIIKYGSQTWKAVSLGELWDVLTFNQLAALERELVVSNISSAKTFEELVELVENFGGQTIEQARRTPEGKFILLLMVWAARVAAGERIGLAEAGDLRMTDVQFVFDPSDAKAKPEAEGKDAGAGDAPPASAPAPAPQTSTPSPAGSTAGS